MEGKSGSTVAFQNAVISCEIASFEGRIQYMFRVVKGHRDLVGRLAVYAQYPDAEIVEIRTTPGSGFEVRGSDWDLWGTEMVPVKPDVFPLRTYPDFEDPVSQEFKDPMTGLLKASRASAKASRRGSDHPHARRARRIFKRRRRPW